MMRRVIKRCIALIAALCAAPAAAQTPELRLRIELPDAELTLPPVSPPQLRREGLPIPAENEVIQRYFTLIGQQDTAGALALLRERYGSILDQLEAGDPEERLQQITVAGGAPEPRNRVSATMLYLIGHVYMALEQYVPAETAFKTALVPLPDYIRVHESLGLLYLQIERYDEARAHLARAASLGLNTPNLYGALGYLNQQTHNYWGAVSAYQQAVMIDPGNESWQRGLLYSLAQTYQHDSALTLIDQMLQGTPDDAHLWLYRAHVSLLAGERAAALTSLETAIRLGEDSAANLQVCAALHLEHGSVGRAIALLRRGQAQGLDFDFLDQALAWLVQANEWVYVEELLTPLLAGRGAYSDMQQSKLLTRQSRLRLHENQRAGARTALQEAVQLDPTNAEALMTLAQMHREDRNLDQAELLYQRASADDLHRENALVSLAQLAIDRDDFERALQLLHDVVERNPARLDLRRVIDSLENLVLLRGDDRRGARRSDAPAYLLAASPIPVFGTAA
jgi:tetratricopeptide (TPR) repeat protein